MQVVSFAAFLLAAALPVIAKVMLGGGFMSQLPLLSSTMRRRLSQRRVTEDRSLLASPLVCPKTPIMQAAPGRPVSRCATPAVNEAAGARFQSPAVRFREPFGISSPGDDDVHDCARPETPYSTPCMRPQSPLSGSRLSRNSSINTISRGRRVSYWDNPYTSSSPSIAAAGTKRRSVPTITIMEVRDGVVIKREAANHLAEEAEDEALAHQRYPRSPYPAKYPQSPFPSKYPQSPYPSKMSEQAAFPPSRGVGAMSADSRSSLLAVADQGADLVERAATWAAERGVDTNVGLEDFEERSYLGRAIRKLRGTSRREKQESARVHVVREARKNWAARSLDATHHLAHLGLEGVEAVGRGAIDGLDAVRRGAAGGLEAVGGALRPRSGSQGSCDREPFPGAEDSASSSSSSSSSRQSSPSPRRRVLHRNSHVRAADDADLACMAAEAIVSNRDEKPSTSSRRLSLSMKSLKDLGRRTRSGTDSSTRSTASDPGSRARSGSGSSSAGESATAGRRRVSLPWNRMK